MTSHGISIGVLLAIFFIGTCWPVNMGVVAFVGAFIVGTLVAGMEAKEILGGFPSGLFLTLVGINYLFATAHANGAIDGLVSFIMRLVGGRGLALPWVLFAVTALLTSFGAASPAAVAIVAPIALGLAAKHQINLLWIGLFVIHGAQAGGFSPVSIFGSITNNIVVQERLPVNASFTFLASLGINLAAAFLLSILMQRKRGQAGDRGPDYAEDQGLDNQLERAPSTATTHWTQALTLIGLLTLAILVVGWKVDIGFAALTIALVLAFVAPKTQKQALLQVSWPMILLVTGVGTYVALLEKMGTIRFVGQSVGEMTSPLLAALILCVIGAVVSAFASSTAVLGTLIPLAVPLLQANDSVDAVGFIAAMAICATIVDMSPFSTNGAIVVSNAPEWDRERLFRQLTIYGAGMTLLAPILVWFLFVVLR
jgi:di/tricarboxylate transporter